MENSKKMAWVLLFAILVSLVQLVPTILPHLMTNGKIYLGFESTIDAYFYAAFVNDAKTNFLLENKHTSEPQLRRYFLPLFNVLGVLANWMDIATVFLLDRFAEIVFFLLALWYFLGFFFTKFQERFWAYLFIPLAGGLGWLVAVVGNFIPFVARIKSYDITYWMGYSLTGHMYLPHRYWALGLALIGFSFMIQYYRKKESKRLLLSALLLPVIFLLHPVTALFYAVTIALMHVFLLLHEGTITKQHVLTALHFLVFSIPIVLLMLWSRQDAVIASQQQVYFSIKKIEPLPFYFIGYGMLLILSIISLTKAYPKNETESVITHDPIIKSLMIGWLLGALVLTQTGFGIEYMIFLFVAFALIAVQWLLSNRHRLPKPVLIALVLSCVLSVPFVLAERTNRTLTDGFAFITPHEKEALGFLDTQPRGILLAPKDIATVATWKTRQLPFSTHTYLTEVEYARIKEVEKFYNGELDILEKYENIDYVWFGPSHREEAFTNKQLELLYSNAEIRIYRPKQ